MSVPRRRSGVLKEQQEHKVYRVYRELLKSMLVAICRHYLGDWELSPRERDVA